MVAGDDKVTDLEGTVEHDSHRAEDVAEDLLQGEAHGDSAHPQAGQQRRDLHAEALRTKIVTLVQRATRVKNRTTPKAVCAAVSVKFA